MRGLYTGIGAQVVRDIPFYASFFGSYDIFCKVLKKSTDWNDTSIYFVAGGYVRYALEFQQFVLLFCDMSHFMLYFVCFLDTSLLCHHLFFHFSRSCDPDITCSVIFCYYCCYYDMYYRELSS